MAYKISWTQSAIEDYQDVITYLIESWSLATATAFESIVNRKLATLSQQPYLGIASQKQIFIRSILLTKHNRLYYRIKEDTIELLGIFDTRKDPASNPF
jgi:plasmid stabilization system protein ParE